MPSLIEEYCRLLVSDTDACAALFAPDADFATYFGSLRGDLKGRDRIRDLLAKAPKSGRFEVVSDEDAGAYRQAVVHVSVSGFGPVGQTIRYTVEGGHFRTFEVIPAGNPDDGEEEDLTF